MEEMTQREAEVVGYIKAGRTQREIAEYLGISQRTVEIHCCNAARKNEVKRVHLVDAKPVDFDEAYTPDQRPTWVYFARADNGRIKIGCTQNVDRRLRALSSGQAVSVELLGKIQGSFADERALHDRLESSRFSGEWYDPTDEVLTVVRRNCPGSI